MTSILMVFEEAEQKAWKKDLYSIRLSIKRGSLACSAYLRDSVGAHALLLTPWRWTDRKRRTGQRTFVCLLVALPQ